jgi:hypothetical protein
MVTIKRAERRRPARARTTYIGPLSEFRRQPQPTNSIPPVEQFRGTIRGMITIENNVLSHISAQFRCLKRPTPCRNDVKGNLFPLKNVWCSLVGATQGIPINANRLPHTESIFMRLLTSTSLQSGCHRLSRQP